jgi:hypothetical protein
VLLGVLLSLPDVFFDFDLLFDLPDVPVVVLLPDWSELIPDVVLRPDDDEFPLVVEDPGLVELGFAVVEFGLVEEPDDVERGDVESGDVEPGDVEPGDVESGDVESGDVEPGVLVLAAGVAELPAPPAPPACASNNDPPRNTPTAGVSNSARFLRI